MFAKLKEAMNVENLDEETIRIVERVVVLRVTTKHINLWIRQFDMKRREICELAGLMRLDEVKKEVEKKRRMNERQSYAQTFLPRR